MASWNTREPLRVMCDERFVRTACRVSSLWNNARTEIPPPFDMRAAGSRRMFFASAPRFRLRCRGREQCGRKIIFLRPLDRWVRRVKIAKITGWFADDETRSASITAACGARMAECSLNFLTAFYRGE